MNKKAIKVSIYTGKIRKLERLSRLIRESGSYELCTASTNISSIVNDCKKAIPDVILLDIDMPAISELFAKPIYDIKYNDYNLTKRECEVLQRLVEGDSYKMVAEACFISIGTVYSHINNIYKKLRINSKSEAVIKTIREHLV